MDILYIILFVISILGWAACLLLSAGWMIKMLNRKGYHSPHIVFWLIPSGMITVTVVLSLLVFGLAYKQLSAIDTTGITGMLLFSLVFYAPLPASVGLFAFILRCVVPLKSRTGPRKVRFPYRGASVLLFVASIVVPVVILAVFHGSIVNALRLVPPLFISAVVCSYLAHRAAAPGLDETVRADARPPVLYLRPFDDEGRIFARPPRRARDVLSQYFNVYSQSPNKLYQTFEEFFTDSVRSSLGPFVALGNPQDTLPPQGGRAYFSDETWKIELARLATEALCILAPVSQSKSLRWELEYLKKSNLHEKLFILTPPNASQPLTSPLARLIDFLIRLVSIESSEKWNRRETVPWEKFRAALMELEYLLPVTDPGLGSIVAFDMTGNAITLVQGVGTADEYVEAIATRFSQAHESTP